MSKKTTTFEDFDSAFDDMNSTGTGKGKKTKGTSAYTYAPRCYESHPAIPLGKGHVYGGSCSSPMVKDADIYVGLDGYMKFAKPQYPWSPVVDSGPIEVLYPISDMQAPKDEKNFVAMIEWLAQKLETVEGIKIHVGCMGGHGRTGTVLAALVKRMTGEEDAITWTRKNYCKKVVESKVQVKFLNKFFGIKEVEGSKENHSTFGGSTKGGYNHGGSQQSLPWYGGASGDSGTSKSLPPPKSSSPGGKLRPIRATPVKSPNSIWG